MQKEKLSSRIGFILVSAGCAIGLGNVWRFPYITGLYGGAPFVLIYLFFLISLGLPIMISEFAVGRASQRSAAKSFDVLEPKGTKWHLYKYGAILGNFVLLMFYTTVSGWTLYYSYKMGIGDFVGLDKDGVINVFVGLLGDPMTMTANMLLTIVFSAGVCLMGVQSGVEKVTKYMMSLLFILMFTLAINSVNLPGAAEGLRYYLYPDFSRLANHNIFEVIFAALGQSFFTLSLGIGALAIFGSYISRDRSLTGEAIFITVLDTTVALTAGLIIFPACFSFGIQPDSGPNLLFITLPNVFNAMPMGQLWGALFFLFMVFASYSTVIAVFENITACVCDMTDWSRNKAIYINLIAIIVLSMPCILGFNVWSDIQPLGPGSCILDLEDFIVSNNLLPLGSLIYLSFCTSRYGWGWKNFLAEVDSGEGVKFPKFVRGYLTYVLPFVVLAIFVNGYISIFCK